MNTGVQTAHNLAWKLAAVIRGEGKAFASLLPGLADGVEGLEFITAAIASSKADGKWTKLSEV